MKDNPVTPKRVQKATENETGQQGAEPMSKEAKKTTELKVVGEVREANEAPMTIAKPGKFSLSKFKSKRSDSAAGVDTLQAALPHQTIAQAKDFCRLHPSEDYWSDELCFVNVPCKGERDTLHLIDEDVALANGVPNARIQRFRLALATKPNDVFFLCHVPSLNLDNAWNADSLRACEQAKTLWTQATSRRDEGKEGYQVTPSRHPDAFPAPRWPTQSLEELIGVTFDGRNIDTSDHPGLLRVLGARQEIS
jgi:hypothetical protein